MVCCGGDEMFESVRLQVEGDDGAVADVHMHHPCTVFVAEVTFTKGSFIIYTKKKTWSVYVE
jgi:hypothetical protein